MMWDALILGGGAAGLNAGIVLARTGAHVLVLDDHTPRNGPAAHMHGFLSRDGESPAELLRRGRDEFTAYGGTYRSARVVRTEQHSTEEFRVTLEDGTILSSSTLLITTGLHDILPDIPGAPELWGTRVHHCPHCHGREVAGDAIAVIGNAEAAAMSLHQAVLMRRYSGNVTFYPNGITLDDNQRAELDSVDVVVCDLLVRGVTAGPDGPLLLSLEGDRSVAHAAAFVAPTMRPRDEGLEDLELTRVEGMRWIDTGPSGRTSLSGVWAAGNVANPRAQVITAAGEGSAAAVDMTAHLLARDLRRARAGHDGSWYSA